MLSAYEFTEFMEYWLEIIKPNIAYTTYIGYAKNIRRIKSYFKPLNIMLCDLKPIFIQNFYTFLSSEGLSGNTILRIHANIRKALQYAVNFDLISFNPALKVQRPKASSYSGNYYNSDELNILFKAFEGDRMELVVHIAAYYGLRRSEIIGLKWDAIDFNQKTITVKHKIVNDFVDGQEIIIANNSLKTSSSRRTLPLMPHIENLLIQEKAYQQFCKGKDFYDNEYSEYVCRDAFGKLITPNYVTDHFRYMIKTRGLKKIRFHDLRHSCASLLLANGIQMKEIQEWLGHSTYNVTANLYSHLDYSSKKALADTITNILG